MLAQLFGVLAAMAGGWVAKKVGKSEKVGGGTPVHKILAPAVALGVGIAASAVLGDAVTTEQILQSGGQNGAVAIGLYSILKNGKQLATKEE